MFLADERGRITCAAKQRRQRLDPVEQRLVVHVEGMQITKLALEVKYNMSETLRAAPAAEAATPKT